MLILIWATDLFCECEKIRRAIISVFVLETVAISQYVLNRINDIIDSIPVHGPIETYSAPPINIVLLTKHLGQESGTRDTAPCLDAK